jgi:REP element-mobilizing transposase RayT
MNNEIRKGKKCSYNLHVHLLFVTKCRRGVFTKEVLEFNGENDRMYIFLSLTRPKLLSLNWPTV